jgi:DNA-binding MarR family transcriptional regulator
MEEITTVDQIESHTGLGHLIELVRSSLTRALDRKVAALGIPEAHAEVLLKLYTGKARSGANLREMVGSDTHSIERVLDRLEQSELIRVEPTGGERDARHLSLTEAGRIISRQLLQAGVEVQNRHLRGFTKREVERLAEYLRWMLWNA